MLKFAMILLMAISCYAQNYVCQYNNLRALSYMDAFCCSINSNFPHYTNDCANFVSQVANAGCLGMAETNNVQSVPNVWPNSVSCPEYYNAGLDQAAVSVSPEGAAGWATSNGHRIIIRAWSQSYWFFSGSPFWSELFDSATWDLPIGVAAYAELWGGHVALEPEHYMPGDFMSLAYTTVGTDWHWHSIAIDYQLSGDNDYVGRYDSHWYVVSHNHNRCKPDFAGECEDPGDRRSVRVSSILTYTQDDWEIRYGEFYGPVFGTPRRVGGRDE